MTATIIHLDPEPILNILGNEGEHWSAGWGDWKSEKPTQTCLHGAIRRCAPVKGDAYIIEEVGARFGFGTLFNDAHSWPIVKARILEGIDITDEMLEETFGPNWPSVVNIVRQAASMTPEQAAKLAGDPLATATVAWESWAARAAATAGTDAREAYWTAGATDAAREAVRAAGVAYHAVGVASNAARVAALSHLIGKHGYTQEHHDTLMAPWISVFGEPSSEVTA